MKKMLVTLFSSIIIFCACNSNTSTVEHHDFFNIDFGMSTVELLEIEGEPYKEIKIDNKSMTAYWYKDRNILGTENAGLQYFVDENGIASAYVTFGSKYSDNKSYVIEYNTVKQNLISEWGEPIEIMENEADFKYFCSWGNKFLELYKNEGDSSPVFWVEGFRSDYLEGNPQVTENWTTE